MKKLFGLAMMGMTCLSCLIGCGKNDVEMQTEVMEETYIGECMEDIVQDYSVFPTLDRSFVGDPMPYYENGVFHVFYLEDLRDGKVGYHPWTLYETSDFCEYQSRGEVIPYADSVEEQDIALGTGSVIKDKNGLYHAFYTGHNDTYKPKEAVMHATSNDLINWTKIPDDTLYAGDSYSQDDFRDPYVLYVEEEKQYWMLIATRYENQGVIAKYVSEDLTTWTDAGVFFENDMGSDSNLECPSLLRYKEKWYLTFSDQWPDRQFHYRVSDTLYGPFMIPNQDVVDGNGFYAGRLETDGENLYAFGWNGTKNRHMDTEEYAWAGNLVVHQLVQKDNGELVPVLNSNIKEKMNHELSLEPVRITETIQMDENNYTFYGKDYEVIEFKDFLGSYLLECKIKNFEESERFGFTFNTDENAVGALNLVFNRAGNKIEFYNTNEMYNKSPQSEMTMNFENIDELDISMLIADGVVSVYVNDQCVLTARMYASQGTTWGIFGINAAIRCEDIKVYK